jgi:hypothetical protein
VRQIFAYTPHLVVAKCKDSFLMLGTLSANLVGIDFLIVAGFPGILFS